MLFASFSFLLVQFSCALIAVRSIPISHGDKGIPFCILTFERDHPFPPLAGLLLTAANLGKEQSIACATIVLWPAAFLQRRDLIRNKQL